ncbi:PREDICTED: amine oxidase [flavin-containing] A-like isoform X2 [Amphimedon queenslandica]|uniref:Amine oxidase n=1 Tax=Amphimedon queenslandica TaxID=400682 RepID=A0A1X7ULI0_AMPQE|nr:PREDICTED: amine oxidase [flavin-containing] A-like isoform X2 [Amphimedon queenslandica]|eukprot:XP_003387549.1 PREDICTED: amine oxidase [flavin-containing] A-like isoform X2 [Amphimedon queenslandica]
MSKQVVIVGAGLSGTTAASYLTQAGVPVKLFEALDRVGGRTYTVPPPENCSGPVDHGAGYVGSTQTAVKALLQELNVETHEVPGDGFLYTLSWGGNVYYMKNVLPDLFKYLAWYESVAICLAIIDMYWKGMSINTEEPWNSRNADEWDNMTVQNWIDTKFPGSKFSNARTIFQFVCRIPLGVEASETSFLYFLWYFKCGSGFYDLLFPAQDRIVVGGTQQLSEKINATLPKESQAQLKTPVLAMDNNDSSKVVITPAGSSQIEAERCILAMTPHTRDYIAFNPLLSPMYHQLPQRTPMGTTIKIHLFYKEKFWLVDKNLNGNATIFDGDSISQTYDCTAPGGTPCLQAFYVGKVGRRMAMMDRKAREADAKKTIGKIFGEKANDSIGYSEFIWDNHPWIGGAPTGTCAPGTLTCYGNAVRAPTGRIHFASTETAYEWTGYMDGAIRAGHRAASEVLKELGKPEPKPLPPVPVEQMRKDDVDKLKLVVNFTSQSVQKWKIQISNLNVASNAAVAQNATTKEAQQFLATQFQNSSEELKDYIKENKMQADDLITGLKMLQESVSNPNMLAA